jgi:hypothetical protein
MVRTGVLRWGSIRVVYPCGDPARGFLFPFQFGAQAPPPPSCGHPPQMCLSPLNWDGSYENFRRLPEWVHKKKRLSGTSIPEPIVGGREYESEPKSSRNLAGAETMRVA